MTQISDEELLGRFVLRARRVHAHSLVQDWDELLYHARGEFQAHIDISGRMSIRRRLPDHEEVFESLASRVRPLTVKSEPVYYVKVFTAIDRLLGDRQGDDPHRERLQQLRRAWEAAEIQGTQAQAYALQSARIDGTEATNMVSDTQLAAAWLYADLVHADATGPKREALAFPLRERYAAAVRLFSHLAALTVETLRLVQSLRDSSVLSVASSAWDDDVVIGATEFVQEAQAFVAPVGASAPDLRNSLGFGKQWSRFTVTDLLRQDPTNHVRVVLEDGEGVRIASYDAAVSRRMAEETSAEWDVLVAGSVIFKFAFDVEGEQMIDAHFLGWKAFDSTNELKLSSTLLLIQLHRVESMTFEVRDEKIVTLGPSAFSADQVRELEVLAETVADIVAIERLTGQTLDPCNGRFDDRDRVRLRRARLIWEGQIVHAMRHPVTVTAPEGNAPQVILTAAGTVDVGGALVPTPAILMRHPDMVAAEHGDAPEAGPQARKYTIQPPEGERFTAWSPDRAQVSNDNDLIVTASWDLIGIDETTFPY
ncbi:hypothetical protein [Micromonospora aurantiaca (nom. illeg.)]|uniref:hypothetical protein n=1 Tax=Micromonospora aurantiaca (nom. illeg.) TaxID=47850 RepID=UPI0008275A1D|nr:hypothetical protein [Micromonospora aurantiaca]SCL35822.1 hypothetical protein GA0070615_2895 [Micromonospora aurantiaca]